MLPLGLALAGGIYLAIALLMDLSSIHLDDLDAACDLSCQCDDCVFWRLTDEAR